jgi:hypothetical protein
MEKLSFGWRETTVQWTNPYMMIIRMSSGACSICVRKWERQKSTCLKIEVMWVTLMGGYYEILDKELKVRTGLNWLRIGYSGGYCECTDGSSGSLKAENFLAWWISIRCWRKAVVVFTRCFSLWILMFAHSTGFCIWQIWKWNDWSLGYLMVLRLEGNVWHCITVHKCGRGCSVEAVYSVCNNRDCRYH